MSAYSKEKCKKNVEDSIRKHGWKVYSVRRCYCEGKGRETSGISEKKTKVTFRTLIHDEGNGELGKAKKKK